MSSATPSLQNCIRLYYFWVTYTLHVECCVWTVENSSKKTCRFLREECLSHHQADASRNAIKLSFDWTLCAGEVRHLVILS